jgi:Siphovirus Gp157
MILAPARERIREQINRLRQSYPEVMDDDELFQLAIESETDLPEFMNRIVARMVDAENMADVQAAELKNLKARRDRYVARHKAMRALAFNIMQEEGIKKLELTQRTLSVRLGPTKVIITDEAALPQDCIVVTTRPDKIGIEHMLKNGMPVPGASLSNAEPVLMVST